MKQNIEIEVPQGFEAKYNPETRVVEIVAKPQGNNNVFDYVDLGLPSGTLWATCNIGANKPEECGDYFMWGSMVPNTNGICDWAHDAFNNGETKFNAAYFNGIKDDVCPNSGLIPSFDIVNKTMGGDWHMPTKEQFQELMDNTEVEWFDDWMETGISGCLFKSINDDSKTLFFPNTGYRVGENIYNKENCTYLWTKVLDNNYNMRAWHTCIGNNVCYTYGGLRCYGLAVRGVL